MIKKRGISLLELIVSLVLISILSLICLPIGVEIYQKNQLKVRESELITALNYARNMALLHGVPLALTPLANSTDWSQGMLLFVDNKTHQYGDGDKLLYQWQWPYKRGVEVSWHGFQSNQYILFSEELQHIASSGHFIIQNRHSQSVKLVINRFGRISRSDSNISPHRL